MNSGQGRLILCDGTDLPIGYCLFRSEPAVGRCGVLIGNIRSVDRDSFLRPIRIALSDGNAFSAHVISHSERHVRFVTSLGQNLSRSRSRFSRRRALRLALAQ